MDINATDAPMQRRVTVVEDTRERLVAVTMRLDGSWAFATECNNNHTVTPVDAICLIEINEIQKSPVDFVTWFQLNLGEEIYCDFSYSTTRPDVVSWVTLTCEEV